MTEHGLRNFMANLLANLPKLMTTLTSDVMQERLGNISDNVQEILTVVNENVQASAQEFVLCAADVLKALGEEVDLDLPQARALPLGQAVTRDAVLDEVRQALTPQREARPFDDQPELCMD